MRAAAVSPFSVRNRAEGNWIDQDFPESARNGLLDLIGDAIRRDFIADWPVAGCPMSRGFRDMGTTNARAMCFACRSGGAPFQAAQTQESKHRDSPETPCSGLTPFATIKNYADPALTCRAINVPPLRGWCLWCPSFLLLPLRWRGVQLISRLALVRCSCDELPCSPAGPH